ncbi:MAG: hypothetical protein GY759_21925 [Chloroflexi bacterium]|nr:hypothetical protein [Chloroflexota bacterium]
MSNSHDGEYFPAFPALDIGLRTPDGGQTQKMRSGLIDTGADITLVPQTLLDEIEAPELDEVRLRSHWGESITVTTYLEDLQISAEILPGVEVVGDAIGEKVLLGHNVLNSLVLLIDGPNEITDVLTKRLS